MIERFLQRASEPRRRHHPATIAERASHDRIPLHPVLSQLAIESAVSSVAFSRTARWNAVSHSAITTTIRLAGMLDIAHPTPTGTLTDNITNEGTDTSILGAAHRAPRTHTAN